MSQKENIQEFCVYYLFTYLTRIIILQIFYQPGITCSDESTNKQDIEKEDLDTSGNSVKQSDDNMDKLDDESQGDCTAENVTLNISQSKEEDLDEDSWDTMFDDDGECLDPGAMEEVHK